MKPLRPAIPAVTIALVDDYFQMRRFIANYLAGQGFDVICQADNGEEFFRHLLQMDMPPDLCLLDLNMPKMDGFDTARRLKAYYPQIRILAFSSCEFQEEIDRALECGAHGFCSKGSAPGDLKKALMSLLSGSIAAEPSFDLLSPIVAS